MMIWNPLELSWLVERFRARSASVLVVEDDVLLKRPLARTLYEINPQLNLRWVTSAEEAKKAVADDPPTLVIADCLLDGYENGLQLWDYLRRRNPEIPFVLMTGLSRDHLLRLKPRSASPLPPVLEKPIRVRDCKEKFSGILN